MSSPAMERVGAELRLTGDGRIVALAVDHEAFTDALVQRYNEFPALLEALRRALHLLDDHRCRVDSRKPAGGGICNVCQARFVLEDAIKKEEEK